MRDGRVPPQYVTVHKWGGGYHNSMLTVHGDVKFILFMHLYAEDVLCIYPVCNANSPTVLPGLTINILSTTTIFILK